MQPNLHQPQKEPKKVVKTYLQKITFDSACLGRCQLPVVALLTLRSPNDPKFSDFFQRHRKTCLFLRLWFWKDVYPRIKPVSVTSTHSHLKTKNQGKVTQSKKQLRRKEGASDEKRGLADRNLTMRGRNLKCEKL